MIRSSTLPQPVLRRPARPLAPIWAVVAVAGWAGVALLGVQLWAAVPRKAGFDLELLLVGGRRVAQGLSPYDASMLAGTPPTAVDLFYSYPPPVAQYLSLFGSVPSVVMLVAWGMLAVAGLVATTFLLTRILSDGGSWNVPGFVRSVGLPLLAVAPFTFPFAIAILFGNLDATFPLLYGLMLVAALAAGATPGRFADGARFAGGAALAIATVTKLHPGSMGLWFLVRGIRERRQRGMPPSWIVLAAAAAVGIVIFAFSLAFGGIGPWADYATVVRTGAAANVVDVRNVGPAAQLGLLLGGSEGVARFAQVVVTFGALALTAWTAWFRDDPLESFGWATVASLVVLPVTWYHYPVALIPVAVAAWLRVQHGPAAQRRAVLGLLGGAIAVSVLALGLPVIVWVAAGLVLVAVRRSLPPTASAGDDQFPILQPSRITRAPLPGRRG